MKNEIIVADGYIEVDGEKIKVSSAKIEFDEVCPAVKQRKEQELMTMQSDFPFGDWEMNFDDEEEKAEFGANEPTKETQMIPIKEINKISLSEDEALVVKLPDNTEPDHANELYKYLCHVFNTHKIVVLIGDIEFTKVDWSKHKKHPLY